MSVIRSTLSASTLSAPILSAALILGGAAQAGAQDIATPFDEQAAQALFDEYAAQFPALNVTVMRDGEILWEAVGGTNRGPEDSVSTDYNFYSIAKMLTGMAYARLEQEGLDLDQSIRRVDADLPERFDDVTLRQLLSHAGGIRHYNSDRDWIAFADRRCETPADALGHFIDDRLANRPGARNRYTTYGFTLLSHLLVRLTETESYDAAMTSVLGDAYRARTDRAGSDKGTNYYEENGEVIIWDEMSAECKFGGGGLIASSRDLAQMGSDFALGQIVDEARIPDLFAPFTTSNGDEITYVYGMSAGYSQEIGSHYALHSGGSPGGRAFLAVLTDYDVSVALTANFDGPALPDAALGLAQLAAGQSLETAED